MNNVSNAQISRNDGPARVGIHGVEGSGKTFLAAYFPKTLFVGAETGIPRDLGFGVPCVVPQTWEDVKAITRSLMIDAHEYETVVFDTVDWIEPMLHRFICARDSERKSEMNPKGHKLESIEDYPYGKGWLAAEEEFRTWIRDLDALQYRRGIHVVLLMHSKVGTYKNPAGADFDRWLLKCHTRIAEVVKEWVENLVFIYYRMDASKVKEDIERNKIAPDRARAKGVGGADRVYGFRACAMYEAKNRVGMPNEIETHDPNEIVSALLADHLRTNVEPIAQIAQRERVTPLAQSQPRPEPVQQQAAPPPAPVEPPRSEAYQKPAHERPAPPPPARREHPNAPNGPVDADSGNSFDRARETVAQRDAQRAAKPQSSDAGKTAARTWTEPAKPSAPQQQIGNTADGPLKLALADAARMGGEYEGKAKFWVQQAGGDSSKEMAICKRIAADYAKFISDRNAQGATANG